MKKQRRIKTLVGIIAFALCVSVPAITASAAANADGSVNIDESNFPDDNFREYVKKYDDNDDGILSVSELESVTIMDVRIRYGVPEMSSLKGIEYFTNIKSLDTYLQPLTSLDISHNTKLEKLDCYGKRDLNDDTGVGLTSLDISNNPNLKYINCRYNFLTELDVSNNPALEELYCGENDIVAIDTRNNLNLLRFICSDNELTSLDVSKNSKLVTLDCMNNQITSLDVTNCVDLEVLMFEDNEISEIDLSNNTELERLW